MASWSEAISALKHLPYSYPLDPVRTLPTSVTTEELDAMMVGVRPITHSRVRELIEGFLKIKKEAGSVVEQQLYSELVSTPEAMVARCLSKRPLVFWTSADSFLLRNGVDGAGGFEKIGTAAEAEPLCLKNLISYDEMQLSALLGVSVPTYFINDGNRSNQGVPGRAGSFEPRGVYVGLVGTRLEKREVMEWQHMVVTPEQNTKEAGYGPEADPRSQRTQLLRLWARFYGVPHLPTFDEALEELRACKAKGQRSRYVTVTWGDVLFNVDVFLQRCRITAEAYLLEANDRAAAAGKAAHVVVVGLGLGVWRLWEGQTRVMLDAYSEVLRDGSFPHIADLHFQWFGKDLKVGAAGHGEAAVDKDGHRINIVFSRANPAAKLQGLDDGKLLVAMYAWDGNSWPGNEFWLGALAASGDPAAACCSGISVLQNPDLNPAFLHRTVFWGIDHSAAATAPASQGPIADAGQAIETAGPPTQTGRKDEL